ncbi:uncharacterized protein [Dysidea avara]|uniref:uncharacterized protein n=1 Tax=Dysidea avara TaxID=196820 RepID=UPI003317FE99
MGGLHHFLGVKGILDYDTDSVWIGQQQYTDNILRKFGMNDCKATWTPVDVSTKLVKEIDSSDEVGQKLYQSAVGSLFYLSLSTSKILPLLAKFCAKPNKQYWTAAKGIFRYLKGTHHYGLFYKTAVSESCTGYSDADWSGDLDDRKSTSGYIFQIGGTAISWRSKKQTCVALSTAEAEYAALSSVAQEVNVVATAFI